jgi:hypothetical protein
MKKEAHLLDQQSTILFLQFQQGLSEVCVENGRIISHATLWPLVDEWYELGTIFVPPDLRQRNLAFKACQILIEKRPQVLLTTTNPIVLGLAVKIGMENRPFSSLPIKIRKATCICPPKKIKGQSDHMRCPLADDTCHLFLKI